MRNYLVPAAAAALFSLAPFAASAVSSGLLSDVTVQSLNTSAQTVTLTDGEVFQLDNAAQATQLQPGAHVTLKWRDADNGYVISRVTNAG